MATAVSSHLVKELEVSWVTPHHCRDILQDDARLWEVGKEGSNCGMLRL